MLTSPSADRVAKNQKNVEKKPLKKVINTKWKKQFLFIPKIKQCKLLRLNYLWLQR